MTLYGNYDVIAFRSCIQILTVYVPCLFIIKTVLNQEICAISLRKTCIKPGTLLKPCYPGTSCIRIYASAICIFSTINQDEST